MRRDRVVIFLLIASAQVLFADATPFAILGGRDNDFIDPYAAFLSQSGSAIPLFGLPEGGSGEIQSVDINSSGVAIIGGYDGNSDAYAAFVFPTGSTSSLLGSSLANGEAKSVAINDRGVAIIGGEYGFSVPYAAFVGPNSTTPNFLMLPAGSGEILSVAINNSGYAIIGGFINVPYAALVAPDSSFTNLSGPAQPVPGGKILSVAINETGYAIIGGQDTNNKAYAALVAPDGNTTGLSGAAVPIGDGSIHSVAMNNKGYAIIGGEKSIAPFAVLVAPDGNTTTLSGTGLPTGVGEIFSVAINNSGAAIIGGADVNNGSPYAGLVAPNGNTTKLSGSSLPTGDGRIDSVAINDGGVAIIGGFDHNYDTPYMALVAPNGSATSLSGPGFPKGAGSINSVAIRDLVPTSFGSGNSYVNTLMPLLDFLSNHLKLQLIDAPVVTDQYLVSVKEIPPTRLCRKVPYTIWGGPVGAQVRQSREGGMPEMKNWIGGAVIGFDYRNDICPNNFSVGVAAAYAFDYVHFSDREGHAKIHQELVATYGTFQGKHFLLEAALWGGPYQIDNDRHWLGFLTSRSAYHGWLLIPHLELNVPFSDCCNKITFGPFVRIDWANNWQGKIREQGASGFNLQIDDQYVSLLRSELGLRLFERMHYRWGQLVLEEKLSYVNKKPFHSSLVSTFFIDSISSFGIEIFSNEVQNLGAAQLGVFFVPYCEKYPYGQINYQIEVGSGFLSNSLSFEIGKKF